MTTEKTIEVPVTDVDRLTKAAADIAGCKDLLRRLKDLEDCPNYYRIKVAIVDDEDGEVWKGETRSTKDGPNKLCVHREQELVQSLQRHAENIDAQARRSVASLGIKLV